LPTLAGFTNIWRVEYVPVNVERLNVFAPGAEVTPDDLVKAGIVKSTAAPIKVLGDGEIDRALTVKAHKFSAGARAKITKAGGTVEEICAA